MSGILADLDELQFVRARAKTLHAEGLQVGARRLGIAPEELVALADRLSAHDSSSEDSKLELNSRSTAFVCGLLEGIELLHGSGHPTASLREGVRIVVERGAHSVIAAYCDLAAVVAAARGLSVLIFETAVQGDEDRGRIRTEVAKQFELGLAIGLAAVRREDGCGEYRRSTAEEQR